MDSADNQGGDITDVPLKTFWFIRIILFITGQGYKDSGANAAFLDGLKPVVLIGRFLGTVARGDVLTQKESQRRISIPQIYSALLAVFFLINAILQVRANIALFQSASTTGEKLSYVSLPGYTCTMFFVYSYMLFNTKRFRKVVQDFLNANQRSHFTYQFPGTFPRFCWLVSIIFLLSGVTENVLFDVQNLRRQKSRGNASVFELYYNQNFYHWKEIIPNHPALTLIYIVIVKLGTWGWVYGDVITIVLNRAITEKFRLMNEEIGHLMSHNPICIKSKIPDGRMLSITWDSVREEFTMLTDLVMSIQKFIAPLILACYGINMYIMTIKLFNWVAPYSTFSIAQNSYVYYAFFQFLFRIATVTYFAAEVHHVSHSIIKTIQRCPNSFYTLSLERLERTLICNPTGICLFGSFMIRRQFFISVISFVFTTEIVLLQTSKAVDAKP